MIHSVGRIFNPAESQYITRCRIKNPAYGAYLESKLMSQPLSSNNPSATRATPPRWTLFDVGAWGLLAVTLAGSCGAWHWLLDLASHFRLYYFLLSTLCLIGICRQKRRVSKCCLGLAVAWNGGLLLPYYLPTSQPAVPPLATTVSIISLNVYTANQDKPAVVGYLRDRQPDLIVVMEIDAEWAAALQELNDLYPHRILQPRSDNFGIGLFSKWPLTEPRIVEFAGTDLPSVVTAIQCHGKEFLLVATHPLPPIGAGNTRERNAQLREVADFVKRSPLPGIVAGDFNATPWSFAFRDFSARSGLKDSALGRGVQGSWNAKSWLVRIPIDHVFVPPDAIVVRRVVGPNVGSDHFPVEATIALP